MILVVIISVKTVRRSSLAALVSISIGILILLHHLISYGRLFDVEDILHHEFFAGVFIAFGVAVFLFRTKSEK